MKVDAGQERSFRIGRGEWSAPEAWMVGASTRLLDCWVPQIEWLRMPSLRWQAWQSDCSIRHRRLESMRGPTLRSLWERPGSPVELDSDSIAIDLRSLGGRNIAHAAISGVMRYLLARSLIDQSGIGGSLIAIVPGDSAPFVLELYSLLEVPVLRTSAPVVGRSIDVLLSDHQHVQMAPEMLPERLTGLLHSSPEEFPSKVYLARQGIRAISNTAEVERVLAGEGFVTVYPERLSVLDQLRLLWQAEEVVGVHGAALALLLPRAAQRPSRPLRLVEVFGPGYIVSLYRCLAARLGASWAAVRGRVVPEVVRDLDRLGERSWRHRSANALRGWVPGRWLPPDVAWQRSHQLSNFEVDVQTVSLALEMVRDSDRPLPERVLG